MPIDAYDFRISLSSSCCDGALHRVGETVSRMLDFVPASFRVKVIRRPRYACASCDEPAVQAPAVPRPIDAGMA